MLHTFRAILKGNVLEWQEEVNQWFRSDRTVQVLVTLLDEEAITTAHSRGQQMAAILEKLAQSQAFSEIEPLIWQREIRKDRERPGGTNDAAG